MKKTISKKIKKTMPVKKNIVKKPILKASPAIIPPAPSESMYEGEVFDFLYHAWLGRFTASISPASYVLSIIDWLTHFRNSPAKQVDLVRKALKKAMQFAVYTTNLSAQKDCQPCVELKENDRRFKNPLWNQAPYNLYSQSFLLCEQWWDEATTKIRGVDKHHQRVVNFLTRQILDVFSPTNYVLTNPEVQMATFEQLGTNFINGFNNFIDDASRQILDKPPQGTEHFQVGKNVAITPGKVVYKNELIELIQYEATTKEVYAEPILISPAWIMKYYILDLSPHNSMVKYLVDKGHTVFIISWKNPGSEDRNLGFNEYVNLGILSALDAINAIVPQRKVHAVGYCVGGTLLMMAAAAMAGKNDDRFKSITLFATEVDFKEAGELKLFVDESQITYLQDIMWEKGYLDGSQMAGSFDMLNSADLIWSRLVSDYLLGNKRPLNDLMAWDKDTTRLPFKMHTEYLRQLFLNNDLVQGHFRISDKSIALQDIHAPMFVVSTLTDHIAPWKSVYKIHLYTKSDITFVLTNGGHNAGIVNEPGHPGRSYQIMLHKNKDKRISARAWQAKAAHHDGSWWPAWHKWLEKQTDKKIKPPALGNSKLGYPVLYDAPGVYVYQK